MARGRCLSCLFVALTTLYMFGGLEARAEPALITTAPMTSAASDEVVFFVGGISDTARSLKASKLEMVIDGQPADLVQSTQSLAEWATLSGEANQNWGPPLSVGLVYLWIDGVPNSVLEGIQGFFRRIPSRTPVYPTVYGRLRQGRARLTAADISRLGDVAYLDGYRPNLIEAVRLDLADLAADTTPLKLLLVVTDGRDFADPKGDGPGDFVALGSEIRKAGVTPLVVAVPPPEADAVQAAANLRDLHDAAGGFLRTIDQTQDIENVLESLGQAVADLQRVRLAIPWTWRVAGGKHRLTVRLHATDGARLTANVGMVATRAGLVWLLAALGVLLLLAASALMVGRGRSRPAAPRDEDAPSDDDDELLSAAHDLIRRGASPRRAVEELTRVHSGSLHALAQLKPQVLSDPRYPYFRTRPGRMRLQEISDILARRGQDAPALGEGVAQVLSEAVQGGVPAERAAEILAGRVPADELTAFAGLDLEQLAEALRQITRRYPALGSPRARGLAVTIQDALRSAGGTRGIMVGWLVRTGGPGARGETLRLGSDRTLVGRSAECAIRLMDDPTVAASHAEFFIDRGEFVVAPLEGAIAVEGNQVVQRRSLTDGETVAIGGGLFVVKSARAGNLVSGKTGPTSP